MLYNLRLFHSKYLLPGNILLYTISIILAVGLKYHYNQSDTDTLLWILKPTASLVTIITGLVFYEDNLGYINIDEGIIIAPACGGVNFFIIVFLMTFANYVHMFPTMKMKVAWLLFSSGVASLLTIIVNAIRIIISAYLFKLPFDSLWITKEKAHLAEGVLVYLTCLYLFYFFINNWIFRIGLSNGNRAVSVGFSPILWYFTITILVPFVRGIYHGHYPFALEYYCLVLSLGIIIYMTLRLMQFHGERKPGESQNSNCR